MKQYIKKIKAGANKTLKSVSVGAYKGSQKLTKVAGKAFKDYKESRKPENQLKKVRQEIQLAKARTQIEKEKQKLKALQPQQSSPMMGLGGGFNFNNDPLSMNIMGQQPKPRIVRKRIRKPKKSNKKYVVVNGKKYWRK